MAKKKTTKKKKLLLFLTALVLVAAIGTGIFFLSKGGSEPVNVYSFQFIGMTEYWGDSQESYGPVTTDKIQTVFLTDTQSVTEVKVQPGDTVKKGDVLMTFDTTLDGLSLERKRLEVEKIKVQIQAAAEQLEEVYNMIPYYPPEFSEEDIYLGTELTAGFQMSNDPNYDGSTMDKAMICWVKDMTGIGETILESLRDRSWELRLESARQEELAKQEQEASSSASDIPEEFPAASPIDPGVAVEPEDPIPEDDPEEETEETLPPTQTTPPTEAPPTEEPPTEEDPNPIDDYYVVFKITQDNMSHAGAVVWQGVQVFGNAQDDFYFRLFNAGSIPDYTLTWEEEDLEIGMPEQLPGGGFTGEQIEEMKKQITETMHEHKKKLKMAEAEYKIMERELMDGNIYADIDGEVISVLTEEESKDTQQPMVKVSGGGGFYVEGSVSELEKDNLKIGQEVTINNWHSGGVYTGEVRSIGDFPSTNDSWNGIGNPNASYYPFQVFVDGSADLQAGSYVNMTYSTASAEHGVYLESPFILTEQGQSYVYAQGANGTLEKRPVTVGKSLWGTYKEILSGVTEEDFLAFPYGKEVREGAPTVESDISALYSY